MKVYRTQYIFEVGDLVISHSKMIVGAMVGRPALVIDTNMNPSGRQRVRLKVGEAEWWDWTNGCSKVRE